MLEQREKGWEAQAGSGQQFLKVPYSSGCANSPTPKDQEVKATVLGSTRPEWDRATDSRQTGGCDWATKLHFRAQVASCWPWLMDGSFRIPDIVTV